MKKIAVLMYGLVAYLMFLATFTYMVGFLGGFAVPKTVDSGYAPHWAMALFADFLLVAAFGIQHSVMARPTFKKWWTSLVPKPIERSTYIYLSNFAMIALLALWQPMPGIVWDVRGTAFGNVLWACFIVGWLAVPLASLLINHFDLFGLRQVYLYAAGKPYTVLPFQVKNIYKYIRHPLMVGWIMAFWFTPHMTWGHVVFATANTAYILIAIYFEERNLAAFFGKPYVDYRARTPMFVPLMSR